MAKAIPSQKLQELKLETIREAQAALNRALEQYQAAENPEVREAFKQLAKDRGFKIFSALAQL